MVVVCGSSCFRCDFFYKVCHGYFLVVKLVKLIHYQCDFLLRCVKPVLNQSVSQIVSCYCPIAVAIHVLKGSSQVE